MHLEVSGVFWFLSLCQAVAPHPKPQDFGIFLCVSGFCDCAGRQQDTAKSSKRTSQSFWFLLEFLVLLTLPGESTTPPKTQNVHLKTSGFCWPIWLFLRCWARAPRRQKLQTHISKFKTISGCAGREHHADQKLKMYISKLLFCFGFCLSAGWSRHTAQERKAYISKPLAFPG